MFARLIFFLIVLAPQTLSGAEEIKSAKPEQRGFAFRKNPTYGVWPKSLDPDFLNFEDYPRKITENLGPKKVLVVGAGIAGSIAALTFALNGDEVIIAEKYPEPIREKVIQLDNANIQEVLSLVQEVGGEKFRKLVEDSGILQAGEDKTFVSIADLQKLLGLLLEIERKRNSNLKVYTNYTVEEDRESIVLRDHTKGEKFPQEGLDVVIGADGAHSPMTRIFDIPQRVISVHTTYELQVIAPKDSIDFFTLLSDEVWGWDLNKKASAYHIFVLRYQKSFPGKGEEAKTGVKQMDYDITKAEFDAFNRNSDKQEALQEFILRRTELFADLTSKQLFPARLVKNLEDALTRQKTLLHQCKPVYAEAFAINIYKPDTLVKQKRFGSKSVALLLIGDAAGNVHNFTAGGANRAISQNTKLRKLTTNSVEGLAGAWRFHEDAVFEDQRRRLNGINIPAIDPDQRFPLVSRIAARHAPIVNGVRASE